MRGGENRPQDSGRRATCQEKREKEVLGAPRPLDAGWKEPEGIPLLAEETTTFSHRLRK